MSSLEKEIPVLSTYAEINLVLGTILLHFLLVTRETTSDLCDLVACFHGMYLYFLIDSAKMVLHYAAPSL